VNRALPPGDRGPRSRNEEPQELVLDVHNDPSMALSDGTVKAMTDAEELN
jgi:hypothetical protein